MFYWKINEEGHLLLDEINDQQDIEFGDTAYWVFDDDKLVPYDIEANINEGMLMIKVN